MRRDAGNHALIAIVVVLAVAILVLLGWLFWNNFLNKPSSTVGVVNNFEECKKAPGSVIQETFPERCVTADGRSFTGPGVVELPEDKKTYCTEAEKLCFDYPSDWTLEQLPAQTSEPGARADHLRLISPNNEVTLRLLTGIGGIGGTCPEEMRGTIRVLEPTPVMAMKGYESEYTVDTAQVARIAYTSRTEVGKFVNSLYLSVSKQYTTAGTMMGCGIGFSQFIEGRHSVLSSDYEGAGVFYFGLLDGSASYGSFDDAVAAFDLDSYQQGAAILASVHYE